MRRPRPALFALQLTCFGLAIAAAGAIVSEQLIRRGLDSLGKAAWPQENTR